MVKFHVGINRYSFQEGSEKTLATIVDNLNKLFGDKKCQYHPEEIWDVNV
jgi:hypothetical protein